MGIRKYLATGFTAYDPANPDRKLMDSPCQAAAESVPASSQTTWFRSVHASVQYSTMHLDHQEVCQLFRLLLLLYLPRAPLQDRADRWFQTRYAYQRLSVK